MDQSILPTTLEAAFTTIAALQHDQSRAIAALKLAEDHLERLAADRDAALDAHAQLQQSHSDSLRALQHALATKSAEMDDLARRVPSQREMAAVRAMLEAEVRNGVKRELETLQVDAKAALAVVERVRNENTKLAEDLAETKSRLETEQQHERTEFMIKIRNLEHQIEKSEAAANATLSRDETVRKLQATIEELQLKNSRLLVENDDLRAAKQSMTTTLTGTTTAAARSDLDHKVALESLRVDRDLLAAKLNRAHDEQQSMIRHRHELSQQLTASQLEVAAAKRASEDRGRAAKEAQWKFDTERTKERAEWERERRELLQRIDELACQVSSYSEGQHERRTDKSNTSVALDLADTCSTLESRLRDAYAQIQELQSEQSADSASREAQAHKYLSERASLLRRTESITAALEEARHELASATRSRQDLDAALARSRESEEHLKAALARATEQRDALSDELATVKEESGWLRIRYEEAHRQVEELRVQLGQTTTQLEEECEQSQEAMQSAKDIWIRTHKDLTDQLDRISAECAQLREAHSKLKFNAHTRLSALKTALSESEKRCSESESRSRQLARQLTEKIAGEATERRETSKQRDNFLEFLRHELAGRGVALGRESPGQ